MAMGNDLNCVVVRAISPAQVPACVPPRVVAARVAMSGFTTANSLSSWMKPKTFAAIASARSWPLDLMAWGVSSSRPLKAVGATPFSTVQSSAPMPLRVSLERSNSESVDHSCFVIRASPAFMVSVKPCRRPSVQALSSEILSTPLASLPDQFEAR